MYTIKREDGKIIIEDWTGTTVYAANKDSLLIHGDSLSNAKVEKIGNMNDRELLLALVNAKKLAV